MSLRNALSIITVLATCLALSVSGYYLGQRFNESSKARVRQNVLNDRFIEACKQTDDVVTILRGEHRVKLQRSQDFLAQHPKGIPGISAKEIRRSIHDEKVLLAKLVPKKC